MTSLSAGARRLGHWFCLGAMCLVLWLIAAEVRGDEPALETLIGEETGIVVELRDGKSLLRDVPNVVWFRPLAELSFVKKWRAGPEFGKLLAAKVAIEGLVSQPLGEFATELFGESVLLAIVPDSGRKPTAVLLSRAAKPDSFARALKAWDAVEPHDVQSLESPAGKLERRQKLANGNRVGRAVFTASIGRTLAISESESLVRMVLSRAHIRQQATAPESADKHGRLTASLSDSAAYRDSQNALPKECGLRVTVNPRAWDEQIHHDHASEPWLVGMWSRLKSISAGVDWRDGVVLHAIVRHETNDLPIQWQQFATAVRSERRLAERLPGNSLLAGELRVDPELFPWLGTINRSEKAQRDWRIFSKVSHGLLGRDLFAEVLPHIRPNVGIAIVPRRDLSAESPPVDGLLTLDFDSQAANSDTRDGRPSLPDSLDGALLTLWNFIGAGHNSSDPAVNAILRRSETDSGQRLRWLSGLSPYQPAYGVSSEHLAIASDRHVISDLWGVRRENSLAAEPTFSVVRARRFPDHQQWLFLNLRAVREFVSRQQPVLRQQLMHWKKLEPAQAERQLERLLELLRPFDAGFVSGKLSDGEVRLSAGLVSNSSAPAE